LLKKLRFREILKENMRSPDDVLADENDNIDEEALHKGKHGFMDEVIQGLIPISPLYTNVVIGPFSQLSL